MGTSASTRTHDHEPPSTDSRTPLTANLFILGPSRVGKTALFTVFQDWKLPSEDSASADVGVDVVLSGANTGFLSRYQREWEAHMSEGLQTVDLLPTGPSAKLEEVRLQPGWPVAFDAHDMPNAIFAPGPGRMVDVVEDHPNAAIDYQSRTFSLSAWVTGCYSRFPQRRDVDRRDVTVLVCFDISSKSSLQAVISHWSPSKLSSHVPLFDRNTWTSQCRKTGAGIRFWLVGCKSDLRTCRRSEELAMAMGRNLEQEPHVTFEEAQAAALEAGFIGYRECSAREPVSVYAVLKDAAEEQRRQISKRWGVPDLDETLKPGASWWHARKESRSVKEEILTGSWDYCNWIKYH